ncbi:MAG TPA: hypothetical protein VGI72_02685 [Gaiellales bacterium]
MISNVVGLFLCLALLVLWLGAKREDRLALERSCRHRWVLESLYDEGQLWYRRCELCGKQQPVKHSELETSRARSHAHRPPERRRPRR